jgi:hypothetical protein
MLQKEQRILSLQRATEKASLREQTLQSHNREVHIM